VPVRNTLDFGQNRSGFYEPVSVYILYMDTKLTSAAPIYLDYMATTPIDPRVISRMLEYMGPDSHFGNPSSIQHRYGQMALAGVEFARAQIAETIGADPTEVVFTSGATEANNLAILGAARFYQRKGKHLITMSTEHKSVLDTFHQLEREGFAVTYLSPQQDGLLDLNTLANALREDTILVSIMQVNNELGVIQPIAEIGELLHNKGIVFHVDAAQSTGKLPIDLRALSVQLLSLSAHKAYGPKGIGALFIRHKPRIRIMPQSYGGGQEGGLRAGTLATHQIVGMGEAFAMAESLRVEEQTRLLAMRDHLWSEIKHLPGIALNGSLTHRVTNNLNFSVQGIDGSTLIPALHKLAVSSMSACASASLQPSYVLKAIGLSDTLAHSSVRLSLGRFTTNQEVEDAITILCYQIPKLIKR